MINNIKKHTVLLFIAVTMLTFSACSEKENEIPGGGGNSTNYP